MTNPTNTVVTDPTLLTRALECARGSYQRDLIRGERRWSGADLHGRAKTYGGRYAQSRDALVARLRAAGIPCQFVTLAHGRLQLVIGNPLFAFDAE